MTPILTLRAEQALLGAALLDRTRLDDITYLAPTAFAHPTNRAVYTELLASRTADPELSPAQLLDAVADRVDVPGVTAAYLNELTDACPAAPNIALYARMVQEAAVRRDLARYADTLIASEPDSRLANALRQQAFSAEGVLINDTAPALYAPTASALADAGTRAHREEQVLADLLQHPELLAEVAWLASDVFTAEPRREIHEAVVAVSERGEPVEELTVIWELERRSSQEPRKITPGDTSQVHGSLPVDGYLSGLFVASVEFGVAVEAGAELLAESLRTSLAADAAVEVKESVTQTAETAVTHTAEMRPQPHIPRPSAAPPLQPPPPSARPVPKPEIRP